MNPVAFQSLHDAFTYYLEGAYYVENQLLTELDTWIDETANDRLASVFDEHLEETRDHVENVDLVFEYVEEPAQGREVPTFDALGQEHERLLEEAGDDRGLRDLGHHAAAMKAEHLEIATYETLISLAKQLDADREVRNALEANLNDEEDAVKQLKALATDSSLQEVYARLTG